MTEAMMPEKQPSLRASAGFGAAVVLIGTALAASGPPVVPLESPEDLESWLDAGLEIVRGSDPDDPIPVDASALSVLDDVQFGENDLRAVAARWNALPQTARRLLVIDGPQAEDAVAAIAQDDRVNKASVFVQRHRSRKLLKWQWPVDVALLSAAGGVVLSKHISSLTVARSYLAPLLSAAPVDRAIAADILLLRASATAVPQMASSATGRPAVGLVLLLNETMDSPPHAWAAVRSLERQYPSAAVACAYVQDTELQSWLERLIRELSHNYPVDVALTRAATWSGGPAPLLTAPPRFLAHSRLERTVETLEKRLVRRGAAPRAMSIRPGTSASAILGIEGDVHSDAVGERLRGVPRDIGFAAESALATASVEIAAALPEAPSTRFLQAKLVAKEDGTDVPTWIAGRTNVVAVRIGPRDRAWPTPAAARNFPVDEVLQGGDAADVTVLCYVPGVLQRAMRKKMTVRRVGPSSTVRFDIPVALTTAALTARIVITHGGRIVQSGRITGPVRGAGKAENGLAVFELDAMIRANLTELRSRHAFDASLLIEAGSTVMHDVGVGKTFTAPALLPRLLDFYDTKLTDVAKNPDKYDGGLESPDSLNMLRELAQVGSEIRDVLEEAGLSKALFTGNRIQLVSTTSGIRVPLELFYDGRAPVPEAELCPGWKDGLTDGTCSAVCPRDAETSAHICPRRFWGFSRVIERHVEATSSKKWDGDFAVRQEPTSRTPLRVFRATAVGGSTRVSKYDTAALSRLRAKLETHDGVAEHHQLATSWADWEQIVKAESPSLLLLLPHTTMTSLQPQLEIGGGFKLISNIETDHIGSANSQPIVVLLGCETDTNPTEFFDVVSRCRRKGAVVVIAFGATIAVKHALPAAEQLIDQLDIACKKPGGSTLGDAMLAARRALAARGWIAALGLAAYGDADWQLSS